MSYELKEYLKAINTSKEKLMDGDDEEWEKKYEKIFGKKEESIRPHQTDNSGSKP